MPLLNPTYENLAVKAIIEPTTTVYIALHSTTPGTTGAHEVSVGRQAAQFATPTTGKQVTKTGVTFASMPATAVKYVGIWTSSTGGTFIWAGPLTTAITAPAGSTVKFAAGTISCKVA